MTTEDDFANDFSGLIHDHTTLEDQNKDGSGFSTIAILRRHPMYDCLVLVKKYRSCLSGFVLEFPENNPDEEEASSGDSLSSNQENQQDKQTSPIKCNRRRLVSRFLDGDDPIYSPTNKASELSRTPSSYHIGLISTLGSQSDDRESTEELVHVPINGLLDRLKNYTQSGVAVDGRVYAFAMGLKTSERFLNNIAMHELNETPI